MRLVEMPEFHFDLNLTTSQESKFFESSWWSSIGVRELGLLMDLRNVEAGTGGGAIDILPALQFATTRTDRPDAGAVVSSGSPAWATSADLYRYLEDLTGKTGKAFFRRGVIAKLNSTGFVRARGILYGSYRQLADVLPPEEIVLNPTNDNTMVSVFPLGRGRRFSTVGVDKLRYVVHGMGNDTGSSLSLQPYVRFYNDPLARGVFVAAGSAAAQTTVTFAYNTDDISLAGLSMSSYQWMELGFGVWKTAGTASRCVLHVSAAVTYT